MTQIQLEYWKHKENQRHNIQTEGLTSRDIGEKIRHNKFTELLTGREIDEKVRHNKASEYIEQHKADSQRITANASAAKSYAEADLATAKTSLTNVQTEGQKTTNWHNERTKGIRQDYGLAEEINFTMQPVSSIAGTLLGKGGIVNAWTYTGSTGG